MMVDGTHSCPRENGRWSYRLTDSVRIDRESPENKIQRVLVALDFSSAKEQLRKQEVRLSNGNNAVQDEAASKAEAEKYVTEYSAGFKNHRFQMLRLIPCGVEVQDSCSCVIVTGGTGSLGVHLAASFTS